MAAIVRPLTGSPLLVVAGPTASGKSEVSLRLAAALGGEVLSIDSVQVFRELDIGSAKPSIAERRNVPHHGIDIIGPEETFNVSDFLRFASHLLSDLQQRQVPVVVCAGTTLYLTALLHGLVAAPKADPAIRQELEVLSDRELHAKLRDLDGISAERLHPHDRMRVIRALETVLSGGSPLSQLQAGHAHREVLRRALIIVLCWPREMLYQRINDRAKSMLRAGLVAEVRTLRERYPQARHAMRTLGYAQVSSFLDGALDGGSLEAQIAMETRRYAKRQTTYWKNEPKKRDWTVTKALESEDVSESRAITRVVQELRGVDLPWGALVSEARQVLETPRFNIELWYVNAARLFETLPPLSLRP